MIASNRATNSGNRYTMPNPRFRPVNRSKKAFFDSIDGGQRQSVSSVDQGAVASNLWASVFSKIATNTQHYSGAPNVSESREHLINGANEIAPLAGLQSINRMAIAVPAEPKTFVHRNVPVRRHRRQRDRAAISFLHREVANMKAILIQIVAMLETLVAQKSRTQNRSMKNEIEVSEIDRAAARKVARNMGLFVKEPTT